MIKVIIEYYQSKVDSNGNRYNKAKITTLERRETTLVISSGNLWSELKKYFESQEILEIRHDDMPIRVFNKIKTRNKLYSEIPGILKKLLEETEKIDIRIKKIAETQEFKVRVVLNGIENEDQSYYTTDKQDAINTLNEMVRQYVLKGYHIVHQFETVYGYILER